MLRTLSAFLGRPAALATSVALHVGAAVVGGHALSEGTRDDMGPVVPIEMEVQLANEPPAPADDAPREEASRPAAVRARGAGHRHAYPVLPDHDAHPHDPSLVHLAGRARSETPPPNVTDPSPEILPHSDEPTAPSTPEAPLRFVLGSAGRAANGRTTPGDAEAANGPAANVTGTGTFDVAVVPESAVDQPARLLSSVAVVYPEAARAAGMEADVPLELVVDGEGRVTSARPLAAQGLGLTEAALRAVRGYRFTPARRAGRAVPVRMRWIVTFRLQ
jgi:protein TonB